MLVALLDEEGDVAVAASVGYHADGDFGKGFGHLALKAYVAPAEVAHHTDDAHVFVDLDGAVFLQFVENGCQATGVVDAERYADFGGGDHVDAGVVGLEYLEYLAHEAGGEEHAAGHDLDDGDVVLGGDGLDFAALHLVVDDGAGG